MPLVQLSRILAGILALCAALPAWGEDWQPLDATGIAKALTGRKLAYESAWQDFRASGKTLYNAGADSWGTWAIRGDRYCSQWPPSATWACYHVDASEDGTAVRFRGENGDITVGRFAE